MRLLRLARKACGNAGFAQWKAPQIAAVNIWQQHLVDCGVDELRLHNIVNNKWEVVKVLVNGIN